MFILRSISKDNTQANRHLGESYVYVGKSPSPELFNYNYNALFGNEFKDEDKISAFLVSGLGAIIPVYRNERNYVMTESGQTFEKLTE